MTWRSIFKADLKMKQNTLPLSLKDVTGQEFKTVSNTFRKKIISLQIQKKRDQQRRGI